MNDPIAPAQGDRIDFAGKYPQFRLFAAKVYDELANNNLAWIKIGDPNAGNLDDIQFATHTEIHAFQVKWSATNKPPSFRYKEFIQLLPNMVSSWRNLVLANKDENKRLSDQGFFRWIDDNDKVMVESIFWTDGNTRMKPPHFGGETGSGWLVLASQGAFSQLRIRYKLEQRQYVHRWNRVKSTHEPRHKEASRIITL